MSDEEFMTEALAEARLAKSEREIPVGAVIVRGGAIIARAHNEKETRKCATAHAEMVAIERASAAVGTWHLDECTMYVTLEPCAMCAGAVVNARIKRLVYGTPDTRFGACETLYNIPVDTRLNHRLQVTSGVLKDECLLILQEFFKGLRRKANDE